MPRVPLSDEEPLLSPERAIRLAGDAAALLSAIEEPDDYRRRDRAATAAMHAALLVLETATDTGDPRVLAAALDLAAESAGWDEDPIEYELAKAAEAILQGAPAITNAVRECARSRSVYLRMAAARGLGPRAQRSLRGEGDEVDAEAAAIVGALTRDEDGHVRKEARGALGGAAAPAWAPFFARDPLAARPAVEAARLRAPLDRAAEALERGVRKDARAFADAIEELPDELAGPLLEAWLRVPLALIASGIEPLVERWVAFDADGARTAAWLREGRREQFGFRAGELLGAALARRTSPHAFCFTMMRLVEEIDRREPIARQVACAIMKAAWPDDADPTPLLELALGAPLASAASASVEPNHAYGEALLRIALAARPARAALHEPLVDALLAGFPGAWAFAREQVKEALVDVAHPRLRLLAEERLRSSDDAGELVWALRHLAGGGHDSERDPPAEVTLREAARDPRLRAAMLASPALRGRVHAVERERLGVGALSAQDAVALAASLRAAGEELDEAEWAVVRSARASLADPSAALRALPRAADWTEEDLAFVEMLAAQGSGVSLAFYLVEQLVHGATPALVSILERLRERLPDSAKQIVEAAMALHRIEERK